MVKGGRHPRNKTAVLVENPLGYDLFGEIFYKVNANCLTPSSNFASLRRCTVDTIGASYNATVRQTITQAYDAVGVPL
jgi:bacillolysin